MEQHVKSDIKVMVQAADQERVMSVTGPANVTAAATEAEILQIGEAVADLYPSDAVITNILKTTQVSYVKDTPPNPEG